MPELPEVETVRRSLLLRLQGRQILWVETSAATLRQGAGAGRWRSCVGAYLADITRRGKYLVFELDDWAAVLHLGMSGRLLARRSGEAVLPHTHLRIGFEGGWELHFIDPRRFGVAVLLAAREVTSWVPLAQLGVDALDGDLEAALASLANSRAPIRNALLDQRRIAGLGNIYANEALARAGIRPTVPAGRLTPARRARLAEAIRSTLADALAAGGTTLADGGFVDAAGEGGYFAVSLAVYGRDGQPCRRCGRAIHRVVLAGRSAYYCPRCQR